MNWQVIHKLIDSLKYKITKKNIKIQTVKLINKFYSPQSNSQQLED